MTPVKSETNILLDFTATKCLITSSEIFELIALYNNMFESEPFTLILKTSGTTFSIQVMSLLIFNTLEKILKC